MSREHLVAVIDDDDPFRTALVELLGSFQYVVRDFASAEDFLAADVTSACACIITDIHLPGMSGLDLMQQLTAGGSTVPVVMITARADSRLEAKAAAGGAVCLLRKPFDSNALIDCLEAL
ncbi:MAG: response regulator [Xanthobacteraceae bacterium]|nr:response regulator [Xanthobacteraceae bacterium]